MKKIRLVDMDSIIADFYFGVMKAYKADTGQDLDPKFIGGWNMDFPNGKNIFDYFSRPGFFRGLDQIPGAKAFITRAKAEGDEVLIVTAATLTNAPGEKFEWLSEHYPDFHRDQVIFAKRKDLIRGDTLIDDHALNAGAYKARNPDAQVIGIEYPYNVGTPEAFTHLVPDFQNFEAAWAKIGEIVYPEICTHCNDYKADCFGGR